MSQPLLELVDLHVSVEGKRLLHGVDLAIRPGEVHVIFGPNGSGKSTLIHTIMGLPAYKVERGDIRFEGRSILQMAVDERARLGIGLSFQNPPVVSGVSLGTLLKVMGAGGEVLERYAEELRMDAHLERGLNAGFSGGEMKRSELLQLMVQQPKLVLLDEPESGVDIDSIGLLSGVMRTLFERHLPIRERRRSGIVVTHTGTILERLNADRGYVLIGGKIMCSGPPLEILSTLKREGFHRCILEWRREQGAEAPAGESGGGA